LLYILFAVTPTVSFLGLLPGLVIYGLGAGFAFSQLTNVILSEIPADKAGVASGANTTVRQVGNALGIAVLGTIVTTETVRSATAQIRASGLSRPVKASATAGVRALGANFQPANAKAGVATLNHIMGDAVTGATRDALVFAVVVVVIGTCLSLMIPHSETQSATLAEDLSALVPLDPEGAFESVPQPE
jgi:hypothetical protein